MIKKKLYFLTIHHQKGMFSLTRVLNIHDNNKQQKQNFIHEIVFFTIYFFFFHLPQLA